MTTITTLGFRTQAAINFINEMGSGQNSLYIFLGQQTPWPNEPIPPVPTESIRSFKTIWDNMLGMELVTLNNMQLVIPRNNWIQNNVYTAYVDTSTNLFNSPNKMYVINSNNEVFKCLANNNSANSTVTPFGLGSSSNNYIQTLSDGYVWKYMYQVAVGDQFFNSQWMPTYQIAPVNSTQYTIEQAAVPGSIDVVNITSSGNNYVNSPQSYIMQILGDGTGANGYANVTGGQIQNIVMVNRGQNYTYANVNFSDPTGTGGAGVAVIPPFGGNGSNAAIELGATAFMVAITTIGSAQGFISANCQFRQNGLILNPLSFGSTSISTNTFVAPYTTLSVTGGVGSYSNTEIVYQGTSLNSFTFVGTIIDFNPSTGLIRLNNTKGSAQTGVILYGSQTNAQRYVTNIINPTVQSYTGTLLDIDNEPPIQRTPVQSEFFQYVIQM